MERDRARSGAGDRTHSAMGSHKGDGTSNMDDKSMIGHQPYTPLVPEQWKEKIRDFKN